MHSWFRDRTRDGRIVSAVALVLTAGAVAGPAHAQDPIHETVVVTAGAVPVPLGSVTRALTILTREEIAQLPVRTVADALRLIASVDVRARGERGVQSDFAIRGANFGQTLVLVDGVRLNDAQTGHHNGDIPVPLDAIERIEVLRGPGSSLFGADAFGGTINIITRRDMSPASAALEAGSFGLVGGRARAAVSGDRVRHTIAASGVRSSGFMFTRDFKTASVSSRTSFGERSGLSASYLWNDFGANGFYGPSPSREWTNQALVAADHRFRDRAGWIVTGTASYRTHGDRFLWDARLPGVSENRHRTHATIGTVKASRRLGEGTLVTAGTEATVDWIRSSNLGDHATNRLSGFGEWRWAPSGRVQLDASARVDRYTGFGVAWSPALGAAWWPSSSVRLRTSAGRAFRVPTFTERYYSDPAHLARPDLRPETAWAGEGGIDLFANGWILGATVFSRFEENVIDWLRATTADRWRTYNIRDVDTRGIEFSARKVLPRGTFVQVQYTGVDTRAASIDQLSKYVLDAAPHALAAAAVMTAPGDLRLAPRIEYKRRTRTAGTVGYVVLDLRVSRRLGRYQIMAESTNLLNQFYQEVVGVVAPPRAVTVSLAFDAR